MAMSELSMRVAIVGASTLRGKELKQVLEDRGFPASDIILLDETVMAGTLTEAAGEPTFIRPLEEDSFDGVRFAFFAGPAAGSDTSWSAAQRAGSTVIDLSGSAAPSNRMARRIPSLDSVLPPHAGQNSNGSLNGVAYASPSAPVIVACTLAAAFAKFAPKSAAVVFFPPVSDRDQEGVDELESQTTNLLSFRPIERTLFDAQVAFNLLSSYGQESKVALEEARRSVAREVCAYLDGRADVPAIQFVQAPVFYGYAFTAYAQFSAPVAPQALHTCLTSLGAKVAAPGEPAPSNVSVAGESEMQLARMAADPNVPGGVWLWGVADNLRLAATNAVRIAEGLLAKSPA